MDGMDVKIEFDDSCRWKSPEEAMQTCNSVCRFGERDTPFKETACFKVWGRGRPRPPISEIQLPKIATQDAETVEIRKPPVARKGRGHLLLDEDDHVEQLLNKQRNISLFEIEAQNSQQKTGQTWMYQDGGVEMAMKASSKEETTNKEKKKLGQKKEKLKYKQTDSLSGSISLQEVEAYNSPKKNVWTSKTDVDEDQFEKDTMKAIAESLKQPTSYTPETQLSPPKIWFHQLVERHAEKDFGSYDLHQDFPALL